VPEVRKVMSLKYKEDFYAWGCFAESRFPGSRLPEKSRCPMFHVKPFSPAPLTRSLRVDVSRETFMRKNAPIFPR
jgi:hypothetical protein